MFCPTCKEEGEKSRVVDQGSIATMVYASPFYDEDMNLHIHDPNVLATSYLCSRGHHWIEEKRNRCWCGWSKQ